MYGKWDVGMPPRNGLWHPLDRGFDEFLGFLTATEAWEHFPKTLHYNRGEVPAEGYTADIFADAAVKYIERKHSNPSFIYLALTEPHIWLTAPPDEVARFRGRFPEINNAQPWNATYAAMVTRMDRGIGRVLDALRRTGQEDNTIVIFSSDQGAEFGTRNMGASVYHDSNYPFQGQKRTLQEGGIRVPGLVRWRNEVPAGKSSHAVLHFIDVLPTVMAAAGGRPSPGWHVDGLNMLDVWQGRAVPPERTLFWEWEADKGRYGPDFKGLQMSPDAVEGLVWYAAMRGDFKFLDVNGARFLYNVEDDPAERRNLALGHQELFRSLQKGLDEWKATDVTRSPSSGS
jgi:arylsulfatase A-like enzyme